MPTAPATELEAAAPWGVSSVRAAEEFTVSWLLSGSAIFSCRRASAAPLLPRPEPRRLALAQEPVVFWRVLRLKLGSSAGGDSLRFLVDFLKLANLACNPEGPGFDVSDLEDLCSFSLLLLLGLGLDAERERLALLWSFPCFTLAPGGTVEEAEATAEDEEEVEAAEEESVMVLHPALAEAADFEASLVGFADLSSAPVDSDTEPLFRQELSVLFLF